MKKLLLSLVGIAAMWASLGGIANAQFLGISNLLDWTTPKVEWAYAQLLTDYDSSRWYLNDVNVECNGNNSTITIKTPKIYDGSMGEVKSYRLFLSPYRLGQLKNNDVVVNSSNIIMKEELVKANSDEIVFTLWENDWIDKNQSYYGFIVPIDEFDDVGTPSKEICFQAASNMCMQDTECDTLTFLAAPVQEHWAATEEHGANCVWMDMANVSHTVKDWVLTLTWTAIPDGNVVEIAIFDPALEEYTSLWTANMRDEKYEYKLRRDWEQNFSLTNGCKELRYKADASRTTPEPKEEPIVTPTVWPAENILIIAVAAIVLYGLYTLFIRKSENR